MPALAPPEVIQSEVNNTGHLLWILAVPPRERLG